MKRTTAIILILVVMVVALSSILVYEMSRNDWNIVVTPGDTSDLPVNSGDGKSGDKVTQIPPETVIQQEEVSPNPTNDDIEIKEEYDVIVFSAEPEGIATAVSAARSNLKVLLVEQRDGPGGLMTYGMLNTIDMNLGTDQELLNRGVFEEFYQKVGRTSFDVATAKQVFQDLLDAESENLVQRYGVQEIEVATTEGEEEATKQIVYVMIDGEKYVAKAYIDCTQDADITAMAGAEYTLGWEDINERNKSMSATLVFKMDGVDWETMCRAIDASDNSGEGHSDYGAWAFGEYTRQYVPRQTHIRLKALNIGKQDDGSVWINSLQILNVNTLDTELKELAYQKAVEEAKYVAEFLQEKIPGFENATLSGVAAELYVRETRHILGEEKLTVKDILDSTYTNHAVAMASYPLDVQTTSIYDWGYVIANPKQYFIPFGCIIPKEFTNLLTVGRSASYSSMAAGSARVIPTGMSLGEAAASAAALSVQRNINFLEILHSSAYMSDLQQKIVLKGGYLTHESKPILEKTNRNYNLIVEMCEKGILQLGYDNVFPESELVSEQDFILLVKTYLKRSFIREDLWNTDHINLLDVPEQIVTPNRAKEIIYDITTYHVKEETTKEKIESFLNIVIPETTEPLNTARVYEILVGFKDFLIRENV